MLLAEGREAHCMSRQRVNDRIGIKGHLGPSWQEWFEGLQIVQGEESVTWLCGFLRDQAALYGILLKIRPLGLTLLSLESKEAL